MTICNMCIEGGARAGLIAPDDTTFEYVHGRRQRPRAQAGTRPSSAGATLPSDDGATYDKIDHDRRHRPRADGHLRHESGHGHPDRRPRAGPRADEPTPPSGAPWSARSSTWRSSRASRSRASPSTWCSSARARIAGSATCQAAAVLKDRQVAPTTAAHGRPGLRAREAPGRARGTRRDLPCGRRRLARSRLLDVHRDERRPAPARPVRDLDLATATSRGARARAAARSWRAR